MAHVLGQLSAALSDVAHLKLAELGGFRQLEGIDDVEWLRLFRQFPSVRTLHVSRRLAGHVALALEDITTDSEMVTELLPSLDLICVEGQPASSIEKFVTARRLSGHPVTVINTGTEFDRRLEPYVSK
ncbi:hypothetical protein EDB86DRAFT_2834598 [Lactarius hatsudake]|nr:hypothetical protein EDB86DRAFT_2834598 [Lactarius hatsudake]